MKQKYMIVDPCQFTANYDYCLLDALAKTGAKVVYATTEFAHGYVPDPEGVKVLRCFFYAARVMSRLTSSGPVRRFLRALEYPLDLLVLLVYPLIARIKLIHFMWIVSPWLDYQVIRLLKAVGCRIVYTAHNPFPHEYRHSDIKRYCRIYQCVDHVIALTDYTKNEIVAHCNVPLGKISVIPHGHYDPLFSHYGCNDALAQKVRQKARGRRTIAFLGGIRPYKGLDVFIEAFPLIKQRMPDVLFLVAGSAQVGDKKELEARLARCEVDMLWADIRFLPVADMKAYLSVTDVLVQPYVSASQSGNTAMAYAAGVPVICTDVGGLREMTEDGKTGYVVAPGCPEALAEAVATCFKGDNYPKLSSNARRAAAVQYSWGKIAAQTAAIYDSLALA